MMMSKEWYTLILPYQEFESLVSDPSIEHKDKILRHPYAIFGRYKTTELYEKRTGWNLYIDPSPTRILGYRHTPNPYSSNELDEIICKKLYLFYKKNKVEDFLNYHYERYHDEPKNFLNHIEILLNKTLDAFLSEESTSATPLIIRRIKTKVSNWIATQRVEINEEHLKNPSISTLRTKAANQARSIKSEENATIVKNYYLKLVHDDTPSHSVAISRMVKIFNGSQPDYPKIGQSEKSRRDMIRRIIKPIRRKK